MRNKRRKHLFDQVIEKDISFEVELINQIGVYWGDLAVLKTFSEQEDES